MELKVRKKLLAVSLIIVAILITSLFLVTSLFSKKPVEEFSNSRNKFIVLVKGKTIDEQFISLIGFSNTDEINAIIFPNNTKVEIPGIGMARIFQAYKFGKSKKVIDTVSKLTGVNNLSYLEISEKQFEDLINWLGGLKIEYKSGKRLIRNTLRGKDFVKRISNKDNEFKKYALKNFIAKLAQKAESDIPNWGYWHNHIETNLNAQDLRSLYDRLRGLTLDDISVINLPGKEVLDIGIKYWLPDMRTISYLLSDFKDDFSLIDWDKLFSEENNNVKKSENTKRKIKTSAIASSAINTTASVKPIQPSTAAFSSNLPKTVSVNSSSNYQNVISFDIAILDGGTSAQAIIDVINRLKEFGLKVSSTNILKSKYKTSYIIYRKSFEPQAKLVGAILKINNMMEIDNKFDDISPVMIMLGLDSTNVKK